MEISVLIQDYFKSKFRSKYSHKNVQYINPIRQEQINRINNRKFDYVISGLDLNMIALAKNILKEGKSCLLLTKEDYVKFNPNKMLSSPFTLSTFFLLARRHFNLDEYDLLKEYLSSYYENLLKLGENMEQGKMSIRLDLNYLLYHQKFYFMVLNNILMYRNNFRNSYLKMDVNKVYFINKDVEYNSAIMKELTKLTLDNRDSFQLMNYCEVSNITQISNGRNRIEFVEGVNNSRFCIFTDNLIENNDLFKSHKMIKKRKDKINAVSLSITNNPDKFLKMKYSTLGYYFNENLKINTRMKRIHNKNAFTFCINSYNFNKFLEIYVGKYGINESSKGIFNFSFFKSQFSSKIKYFKMKFGGFDNFLESKILDLIILKNPINSVILREEKEDLRLSNFVKVWSENNSLSSLMKSFKFDDLASTETQLKGFQKLVDSSNLIYKIDKQVLRSLYGDYGKILDFILITGQKLRKNQTIGEKNKILVSQILFEINFLNLHSPVGFLLRRHNYSVFVRENPFSDTSKILTVFAEELSYNKEKYETEFFKLLAYKYLLTKYSLDL